MKPNAIAIGREWSAVFARLVLGYVVALPFIVPQAARHLGAPYTMAITMQSPITGPLELVHDLGDGFAERPFATVPLHPSAEPHEYRLELPPGRYHRFRIDPGATRGRYTITRAAILAPDESLRTAIPLDALVPLSQISVVERSDDRLVVEAPPGSTDPQLLYTPQIPVVIPAHVLNPVVPAPFMIAILWLCGIGVVRVIELALHGFQFGPALIRAAAACEKHPRRAVAVMAVVATIVSTYPVLLLGRSLFTPNIGAVPMLYGDAPFTPGSTDRLYEDPRGSDVWAAILQDVPHSIVQRAALAQGEIPLWNRHNAAGRPLWGQGLTFLLDPLHWLTLVTPNVALGSDLKFVAHRLVFALGVGLVALVTTGAVAPAMIAASAAPFAGVYAFRLNHPGIFVLTYAPWILLGWFRLAAATDARQRARAALLLAVSSALLLFAANPKDAAITLPGLALAGTIAVLASRGSWRDRGRRLFAASLAGVAVILVTAPHWLIFLDTLGQAFTVYDRPYAFFATRQHATAFFLGPLTAGPALTGLHLLGLVLIIAAITAPGRFVANRATVASGIVAAVLIAVAFGALPASLLVRIPLVGNIGHIHDTFLTAALPLLLVVAAVGAEVLLTAGIRRASGIAAIAAAASWWLFHDVGRYLRHDGFSPGAVLLMAPVVVTLPWCFYAVRMNSGRALPHVAIAAAVLALLLPGGLHLVSGLPVVDELVIQPRDRPSFGRDSSAVEAVHRASTEPTRTIGVNWTLIESSHAVYGLEGIGGADPLEVAAYKQLVDAAAMWRSMWVTVVWSRDVPRVTPLLDLLNVGYFVGRSDTALPADVVEIPMAGPDRLKVGRRPTAWPRAFFVDGVKAYADVPDLLNHVAASGKPFAAIQTGDGHAADATRGMDTPSGDVIPASRYKLTPNTTSFAIRAPKPGFAVLTETFLPDDFHATLNGARVPYFRVNQAFKAVRIPSGGDWVVKFEYRPAHWELSLALAGLGLALLGGLGLRARAPRYALDATLSENPALRASS